MGRAYAGILGTIAFATIVVRALVARGGVEDALWMATLALISGAAVGFICGAIAELFVRDSVRAIIADQLQQVQPQTAAAKRPT